MTDIQNENVGNYLDAFEMIRCFFIIQFNLTVKGNNRIAAKQVSLATEKQQNKKNTNK